MNINELTALDMNIVVALLKGLDDVEISNAFQISEELVAKRHERILDIIVGEKE